MTQNLEDYCDWQLVRAYSIGTIRNTRSFVGSFIHWCKQDGVRNCGDVGKSTLDRYQLVLYMHRKRDGKPLSLASQHNRMVIIAGFFRWLTRQSLLASNPASCIELPRLGRRLPKAILTAQETEQILCLAECNSPKGLRDRTILEVLYCTGIRRTELVNLKRFDINLCRQTLLVREGKRRKDRLLPLSSRTAGWIDRYLSEGRPMLLGDKKDYGDLFLRYDGLPLSSSALGNLVHKYIHKSGIRKSGSCHLFRHTVATLMLENGADIRHVQLLLGHERLQTTEIYTHVNIRGLMDVHRKTHPTSCHRRNI